MDDAWKAQIQFAQDMVAIGTVWMRSYGDRETCFRFVRAELLEKQTSCEEEENQIHSVFDGECGYEDSTTDTEQNSE